MNVLARAGEVAQNITRTIQSDTPQPGLPTGLGDLDRWLMGFRPGDLVVVAGDGASGKTAFAIALMRRIALDAQTGVLVFSPSKSADFVVSRLMAAETQHSTTTDVRSIARDAPLMDSVAQVQERLADAPIHIYDAAHMTLSEIRSFTKGLRDSVRLLIVDEATDIRAEGWDGAEPSLFVGLKNLAVDMQLPILAICPLESTPSKGENYRPTIRHVPAECAASADSVLLTYYPSMYGVRFYNGDGDDDDELLEIIVAKNRYNSLGSLHFALGSTATGWDSLI